ncbi:hypothetical protein COL154_010457 [Colletotrichum chrysophilum]|uniref:uncharacterized protein n=1 Tax=Colletotrichum chrysophilum TaxID=1836956 RepID=UPI002300CFF0|nr:uncharacterized protein COL26b_013506 [Colletotrichum chrysophilum]KAJ0340144.1 hypothetical protein KNSL1_011697 [Colletotrichum chrysophilum]KAJ0357084.1 hypothetical protein COL154_010457 [Colletotrichum chrysophilum]KAJ0362059.1 hypothetical protein COL26b_013506 [Colletotrichum chrysophilum]
MLVLRLTSQGLNPGLAQERVIRAINNRIIKNLNNSSTLADESPPNAQKRGRDTSNCSDRQPTKKKAQVALLPPRGNEQAPG